MCSDCWWVHSSSQCHTELQRQFVCRRVSVSTMAWHHGVTEMFIVMSCPCHCQCASRQQCWTSGTCYCTSCTQHLDHFEFNFCHLWYKSAKCFWLCQRLWVMSVEAGRQSDVLRVRAWWSHFDCEPNWDNNSSPACFQLQHSSAFWTHCCMYDHRLISCLFSKQYTTSHKKGSSWAVTWQHVACKPGQTDLVFGLWSECIRRSVHAGLQSLHAAVMICATLINRHTHTHSHTHRQLRLAVYYLSQLS